MDVAIIGGNECMEKRYKDLCSDYNCNAKVFTKQKGIKNKLGNPDLVIFFTNTVSHKMVKTTMSQISKSEQTIVHCKSSSISSLKDVLSQHTAS